MIQFNLLPEVKLKFIKAQRAQRLVVLVSAIISAATLALLIILLVVVDGLQKKNISDLSRDITNQSAQLKNTKDLNKILTIQNQLTALPALDGAKPVLSRSFGYLQQVTPTTATIASTNWDMAGSTVLINGSADSLSTVNTYVDTLKFATYTPTSKAKTINAFTNVVLTSFSVTASGIQYTISASFAPVVFSSASTSTSLSVPSEVSTRSVLDQSALFQSLSSSSSSTSSGSSNSGGQ